MNASEVSSCPDGTSTEPISVNVCGPASSAERQSTLVSIDVRESYIQASSISGEKLDRTGVGHSTLADRDQAPGCAVEHQRDEGRVESGESSPWQSDRPSAYYRQCARREFDLH